MCRSSWRPRRRSVSGWLVSLLACGGPARVWIGGDVHWGEGMPDIAGVAPPGIGIVNLEGPVSATPVAFPLLANHPRGIPRLAAAGVRYAGIANNHDHD